MDPSLIPVKAGQVWFEKKNPNQYIEILASNEVKETAFVRFLNDMDDNHEERKRTWETLRSRCVLSYDPDLGDARPFEH